MGLPPDNTTWFTRAPGHRVTVLEVSSSVQAPLPAAMVLEFQEYKPSLAFSMTYNTFLGKLRTPLALPASCLN